MARSWERDELILALDLYFRVGARVPSVPRSVVPVSRLAVSADGRFPFNSAVIRAGLREGNPTPAPQRNPPLGVSKPAGFPRTSYPA